MDQAGKTKPVFVSYLEPLTGLEAGDAPGPAILEPRHEALQVANRALAALKMKIYRPVATARRHAPEIGTAPAERLAAGQVERPVPY